MQVLCRFTGSDLSIHIWGTEGWLRHTAHTATIAFRGKKSQMGTPLHREMRFATRTLPSLCPLPTTMPECLTSLSPAWKENLRLLVFPEMSAELLCLMRQLSSAPWGRWRWQVCTVRNTCSDMQTSKHSKAPTKQVAAFSGRTWGARAVPRGSHAKLCGLEGHKTTASVET